MNLAQVVFGFFGFFGFFVLLVATSNFVFFVGTWTIRRSTAGTCSSSR